MKNFCLDLGSLDYSPVRMPFSAQHCFVPGSTGADAGATVLLQAKISW